MSRNFYLITFCCCFALSSPVWAQATFESQRMTYLGYIWCDFDSDDLGVTVSDRSMFSLATNGTDFFSAGRFGTFPDYYGWIQRVNAQSPWNPQYHEVWHAYDHVTECLISHQDTLGFATFWGDVNGLVAFDLDSQNGLNELGRTPPDSSSTSVGRDLAINGDYLYAGHHAHWDYISIFNISDPQHPILVNLFDVPPRTYDTRCVEVFDDKLFVCTLSGTLNSLKSIRVYDIGTTPEAPVFLAESQLLQGVRDMAVRDGIAYVADDDSIQILDVSDLSFNKIASIPAFDEANTIYVKDDLLYVGDLFRITIYDVSNPASPQELAYHWGAGARRGLFVKDDLIYTMGGLIYRMNAADYSYTVDQPHVRFGVGAPFWLQEKEIEFTNNGNEVMTFTDFQCTPSYITPDSQSLTIEPGEAAILTLSAYFVNDVTGSAHLAFSHSGASQRDTIKVSGDLIQDHTVEIWQASEFDFGEVHLDSSAQRTFKLNFSEGDVHDLRVAYMTGNTGDFTMEGLPLRFPPPVNGEKYRLFVTFKPTSVGEIRDTLTLIHNFEQQRPIEFIVSGFGVDDLTSTENETEDITLPDAFSLSQNYPNPFNPSTRIEFALPQAVDVRLEIYDIRGVQVRTLVNSLMPAGYHNTKWDGRNDAGNAVSSGIYILQMQAGKQRFVKKMTLLR